MRKRFLQKHLAVDTSFFINYIKKGTRITVREYLQKNYFGWIKSLSPSIPEEYKHIGYRTRIRAGSSVFAVIFKEKL